MACGLCYLSAKQFVMSSFITSNMRLRMKLILQAVILTLFAAYTSLFVYYHNVQPSDNVEHLSSWQERAPRSISNRDYDSVVNSLPQVVNNAGVKASQLLSPSGLDPQGPPQATAQSLTSLSDVFISVKTTSSFHRSRLDVILKTWFSLAKEEVSLNISGVAAPGTTGSGLDSWKGIHFQ